MSECFGGFFILFLQLPNKSLVLAVFAACIGGTFQYGYNISVINAPTVVNNLTASEHQDFPETNRAEDGITL